MLRIFFAAALAAITPFMPRPADAETAATAGLVVEDAWARPVIGGGDRSAGYATMSNEGAAPVRVIAAETPRAGRMEFHETTLVDDVTRMRELEEGLEIGAGQTLTLEPGGLHIMFLEVGAPFGPGDSVPARLILEDGGAVEVEFSVRAPGGASSAAGGHDDEHSGHDHDH